MYNLAKNEKKMILKGKQPAEYSDVPLPEFKVMTKGMKEPKLSAAYQDLGTSAYKASLKRLVVVECGTADLVHMEPVWKDEGLTGDQRHAEGSRKESHDH